MRRPRARSRGARRVRSERITLGTALQGGEVSRFGRRCEFALALVALLVLARSPVLFLRLRAREWIGGPLAPIWQDDFIIRAVFAAVELTALVVVVRQCGIRGLRHHGLLLAFLAFCLLSTIWSVEPDVTAGRSSLFAGTAAVGWFLGARFRPTEQAVVVVAASGVGAAFSFVAVVVWPDVARSTNEVPGIWSGVYVNRNLLGGAMAVGLLALPWALTTRRRPAALVMGVMGTLEAWLLLRSGSRTPVVAVVVTVTIVTLVVGLRSIRRVGVTARGGAALTVLAAAAGGYEIDRHWDAISSWLGRNPTLTRRTEMWAINRDFFGQRPWTGWGLEAIWTHPSTIESAAATFHAAPLQAHSGYLEILLGVGVVGFALFLAVVLTTLWRAFAWAWVGRGLEPLWPLAIATYVLVVNISESFFIANDYHWALLVAAGVSANQHQHPR